MFNNRIIETADNLLYSVLPTDFDTRPAEVITFLPKQHPSLVDKLNSYSKALGDRDTHRLLKNYVDINFNNFPFVTMLRQDKIIVGFTTGYTRDFYRKNDIRILTRYYQDSQNLRTKFTREVLRPTTYNIVLQQLEMAKRLGFDNAFISREPRTNGFFKKFINAIDISTDYSWEYREGPFLVAPDPPNLECWQTIAVTNLNKKDTKDFWEHWRTK